MSIEQSGLNAEHAERGKEHRKERYDFIREKAQQSEYWDKPLPGVRVWDVGGVFSQLLELSRE
ncbi:MAG: hypothetical protein H8D63_02605 [Parcubacteria group bacterium]|nr:hypothetical protein [Parcubacteria group bacterium]